MSALSSKHRAHSYFACVNVKPVQTLLSILIPRPDAGHRINSMFRKSCHYTGTSFAPDVMPSQCTGVSAPSNRQEKPGCSCIFFGRALPFSAWTCRRGTLHPLFLSLVAGYALICFQLRCIIRYTISPPESGQIIICAMPQLPVSVNS